VLFSWELLRDKGRPNHRQYYSKVAKAEATDPLTVRFDFGGANDRELPLILGPDAGATAARRRSPRPSRRPR
jgi:peptide/nickel transport system substrate-binding protein